jgi:hypothetical protein
MRRLTGIAIALYLAGAATSLIGFSVLIAAYGARQAVRAAPLPLHPWGTAAGLFTFPLGLLCWQAAQRRLADVRHDAFHDWRMREI